MRKAKSNRIYYLSVSDKGITKINREDVNKAKEAVLNHTARFQLHAVFAPDIEVARQKVIQHKTEIYGLSDPSKKTSPTKDLSGSIRICGAYFPTTDSKGKKIQRCLFYQPVCKPKGCKTDTELAEIKNPYQEEFPFLEFRKYPNGKYRAYYSGTNQLYEINDTPINFEFSSPKEAYRIMLYKLKPEIESLKRKTIPEQSSFIEPSQASLFGGLGKLSPKERQKLESFMRYNLSVKNLPEDRIKELALTDMGYRTYGDIFDTKKEAEKIAKIMPNSVVIKEGKIYGVMYKPEQYMPIGYDIKPSFVLYADNSTLGKLSGFTAVCKTFKKNAQGKRYCAKYAPVCGADAEGCLTKPAPVPGREFIPMESVVKQIAKDIAYEYNERLDGARELMRTVKKYGGIAPYSGNYLKEEYKDIPTKYKSENGIKLDELASEIGFKDERSLVDAINSSENEFNEMKAIQGGTKIRRFKTDDFLNTAYNKLIEEHGYKFSGIPLIESGKFTPDLTKHQIRVRVLNPQHFHRYFVRRSSSPGVQYAMGINDKGKSITQSVRFDKKLFSVENAKIWFKDNIGRIIKRDMKTSAA